MRPLGEDSRVQSDGSAALWVVPLESPRNAASQAWPHLSRVPLPDIQIELIWVGGLGIEIVQSFPGATRLRPRLWKQGSASVLPGSWLEMQIPRHHPGLVSPQVVRIHMQV